MSRNLQKIAKKILVEGTKLVCLGAGATFFKVLVTSGLDGIKEISLDDLLEDI